MMPSGDGDGRKPVDSSGRRAQRFDVAGQLSKLQRLLTLPRETIPKLTAEEAARYLRGAAESLGLQFVESEQVVPIFLLLPRDGAPSALLLQTWHSETMPVEPASVSGAERLALGVAVAGMEIATRRLLQEHDDVSGPDPTHPPAALIVAPAASAGSQGLDRILREHRARLSAQAIYWLRIVPSSPGATGGNRRHVFLGSRGRVVLAMRGGEGNPYRIRDAIVEELREQAYGPRPFDFELIRKLSRRPESLHMLGDEPARWTEEGIRGALFDARGDVVIPPVPHPDRPRAWLAFEIAEGMEPEAIAARAQALSGGGEVDLVERFPWDRASIHHPAVHALIELAKAASDGAEIWPSSPWPTPSGLFTRALGTGLAEWGIPLPPGSAIRFPQPDEFEAMALEAADLIVRSRSQRT